MSRPAANITLVFILIAYLALGTAYALQTPAWQAPDEPAHYNFIKFIARNRALPVLQTGDYNQTYNEEFTRTPQNIASLSIAPLRYENYAPPLYYVLAAPIFALADGWLTAIRLFSLVLGGALVVVAYLIGAEAYPDQMPFALGGAAFVAFVPQHLAMMSAVNNDSLSELLIALVALLAMGMVVLLGLGIVYNIAGLVLQQSMMSSFTTGVPLDSAFRADSAFQPMSQQFSHMMAGMRVAMTIFAIGFAALFAWIIVKLVSRPIREEFGITPGAA